MVFNPTGTFLGMLNASILAWLFRQVLKGGHWMFTRLWQEGLNHCPFSGWFWGGFRHGPMVLCQETGGHVLPECRFS